MTGLSLDASQQRAVDLMLGAPIAVITGGPGTGKTTTTRAALDALDARGRSYVLASPTGKAARRLSEVTGREATTIHRLLGYGMGDQRGGFLFGEDHPIETDVVIVDEASMVDVQLAAALFEAVQPPTRLVLVGDVDQLPSVGEGSVLADLIESGACPVARLTTLHRAAAESWVCSQSPRILTGRLPDLAERRDFRWIEREGRDAAADALVQLVAGRPSERGGSCDTTRRAGELLPPGPELRALGVESLADVQVLVPQTVGPAGTRALNTRLQALLNPRVGNLGGQPWRLGRAKGGGGSGGEDDAGGFDLRLGDRVIQTRNDYKLNDGAGVMNGEVGAVVGVEPEQLLVRFDGSARPVAYDRAAANGLALAYALTVHKYQGSEVPWAVVFCHSTHSRMLERTLLYTAVTRAKRGVVLVGDRVGLERAVKNAHSTKRNTGLAERIREGLREREGMRDEEEAST